MAIDLSQFHQVFFEESFENLDIMESSLMELDPDAVDDEVINAVFRAAHSIKGGSATFGFSAISQFTHILETLLDQIRSGKRGVSKEDVNLFLTSVDCIREMLTMLQNGEDAETEVSRDVAAQFTAILEGDSSTPSEAAPTAEAIQEASGEPAVPETDVAVKTENTPQWHITFSPHEQVLKSGNDPYRLLKELAALGDFSCTADWSKLPDVKSMDAEASYLSWNITLSGDVNYESIEEIFEWVADESDLSIEGNKAAEECSASARQEIVEDEELSTETGNETFWEIVFLPSKDIFRTGNDPLKLFTVLGELGQLKDVSCTPHLPSFNSIDSELCYLSWTILLEADISAKKQIEEVFEWVNDESDITIKPIASIYSEIAVADTAEAVATVKEQSTTSEKPVDVAKQKESTAPGTATSPNTAPKPKAAKKATSSAEASSIRVGIDKVDNLINMVGELVITQSMLGQLGTDFDLQRLPKLLEGLGQLEQNTRELQESVMRIRMLPISFVFSRFPRMVRDLSQKLNKEIQLELLGEQTELDKTVLEKIGDPLVHLVRNAVDHGIESPEEREAKGKSPEGKVTLNAYHQGGNVVIEVVDDGKGLDPNSLKQKAVEKGVISASDAEQLTRDQAFDLIFQPGFSTAKEISDVSGRGVGMDVVKRNIQALNGAIDIHSQVGVGSTLTIRLPLTLAILDGQLVRVADQTYIFPIVSIVESMQCRSEFINKVAGGSNVFRLRDEYVPIIQLSKAFNINTDNNKLEESLMVVVESEGEKIGIVVDELLAQQQVVIKSLEQNYRRVNGVSGATILGDGTVALIVDIPGIVRLAGENLKAIHEAAQRQVSHGQAQQISQIGF